MVIAATIAAVTMTADAAVTMTADAAVAAN